MAVYEKCPISANIASEPAFTQTHSLSESHARFLVRFVVFVENQYSYSYMPIE